jgi:RNA polymerase sigma factor (sigma-70 family)
MPPREEELSEMMRAAIAGDAKAYRDFLEAASLLLRPFARRNLARARSAAVDPEDIVQETLLAIHLKRHTWDSNRPIGPWIAAIARNKLVDALRRCGRRLEVTMEGLEDVAGTDCVTESNTDQLEIGRMLQNLTDRQRDIVRSLSLDGATIQDTARRLAMSEGAVRVSLHRALRTLAHLYRRNAR